MPNWLILQALNINKIYISRNLLVSEVIRTDNQSQVDLTSTYYTKIDQKKPSRYKNLTMYQKLRTEFLGFELIFLNTRETSHQCAAATHQKKGTLLQKCKDV